MTSSTLLPQTGEIAAWRYAHPELFARPFAERWRNRGIALLLAAIFVFGLWWIDATPPRFWNGAGRLGFLIKLMLPPSTGGVFGTYLQALGETLAMAFFGTFLSTIVAFPLGFLGARNIVPNIFLHFGFRRVLDVMRGIDILIWALIFVSAVGMGPFAGVLAIAFSDVAFLTKIYAEAIENVDRKPIEGTQAAGANRLQAIRLAVVPQVLPVILSSALYFFESNVRAATILGIVGAGGIGLELSQQILVNNWDQALFIIIMMLVAVAIIDFISRRIRLKIIGGK
ncbi:phosphonate ABC transporter, permease protein PhnE [Rhizobium mayense]|uniref:Phosphonate ABC transporter, permease protein PhnE n=1 Tax=Rhizobium mayense TaxID=1312184 RepID=A0ABT7JUQ8_9HYPH|nr:phosphonate ABC transporter, permease protein PhnE [Rhizobium mayense]MDL2400080.1 phosphonate ABC transporter, permease protein PhnE [Rhizobium mayense]